MIYNYMAYNDGLPDVEPESFRVVWMPEYIHVYSGPGRIAITAD